MRMSMVVRLVVGMAWLGGWGAGPGFGQVRVVKEASHKAPLDLTGLAVGSEPAAQEFLAVLRLNLERSGWFQLVGAGQGEYRVLGQAVPTAGEVRVEVQAYAAGQTRAQFSRAYREPRTDVRALAQRVTDDLVEALVRRRGIATTRIALLGTRTGGKEIYLADADGGRLVQLTRDNTVSVAPRWSPDARQLVYTSFLRRFPDVYLIELASGQRTVVANYGGLNAGASFSPDGQDLALVLSRDGNPELYLKNLASGRLTRLTHTPRAVESSPSWSPDGSQIVYVSDETGRPQLYLMGRAGGRPRRLTQGGESVAPSWGPDGRIAYAKRDGGRYRIYLLDPQGGAEEALSPFDGADYEEPSWAPNGRHIACARMERYQSAVYILDTLGDRPVRLLNLEGEWYAPAWSPK